MFRAIKVIAIAATSIVLAGAGVAPASSDGLPSGERAVGHGHAVVEPAYNADTGGLMYLLTPSGAPLPSISNSHARSPLFLVEYPPGFGGTLNCTMGNWSGEPSAYSYAWQASGTAVGTDAADYTVTATDSGKSIVCIVTATNANGATAAPPSNAVAIP